MTACVLDASATLAAILPDELLPSAAAILRRVAVEGAVAPATWVLEVINGVIMAERRGRITPEFRVVAFRELRRLPPSFDEETAERCWRATAEMAIANGLTLYDASYLELASRLRLPLATLDGALATAARREGVEVL